LNEWFTLLALDVQEEAVLWVFVVRGLAFQDLLVDGIECE
jgi:hypothetical protein